MLMKPLHTLIVYIANTAELSLQIIVSVYVYAIVCIALLRVGSKEC